MISEEEKKAIENFKSFVKEKDREQEILYQNEEYYRDDIEQNELFLKMLHLISNLIEKQNKESEEKEALYKKALSDLVIAEKMTDEMAEYIDFDKMNFYCSPLCFRPNCKISCIKEHFRKKIQE